MNEFYTSITIKTEKVTITKVLLCKQNISPRTVLWLGGRRPVHSQILSTKYKAVAHFKCSRNTGQLTTPRIFKNTPESPTVLQQKADKEAHPERLRSKERGCSVIADMSFHFLWCRNCVVGEWGGYNIYMMDSIYAGF